MEELKLLSSEMEYNICRLCLCNAGNFISIFVHSDLHNCELSDLITDLLKLQVSKTDPYPEVICSSCFKKLAEFGYFKEMCYSSKSTIDKLLTSNGCLSTWTNDVIVKSEISKSPEEETMDHPKIPQWNPLLMKSDPIDEEEQSENCSMTENEMDMKTELAEDDDSWTGEDPSDPIESIQPDVHDAMEESELHSESVLIPSSKKSKKRSRDDNKEIERSKRARHSITLETKMDIIKRSEKGERLVNISRAVSLAPSTVRTILNNADKIKVSSESAMKLNASRVTYRRSSRMEKMEKLLCLWMEEQNENCGPPSIMMIQEKARSLWLELKESDGDKGSPENLCTFKASHGWFERFKNRANLQNIQMK